MSALCNPLVLGPSLSSLPFRSFHAFEISNSFVCDAEKKMREDVDDIGSRCIGAVGGPRAGPELVAHSLHSRPGRRNSDC